MQLFILFAPKLLNYVVLFLTFILIGNVKAATNEATNLQQTNSNKEDTVVLEQKTFKKQLKVDGADKSIVEITPPPKERDDHTENIVIIDEKSIKESTSKGLLQQIPQKGIENTEILKTVTTSKPVKPHHHQEVLDEDFVLNDEDDASESLKTGFYFFLILSSGAVVFILFKIYRLRLSRAERKYGVQGDRTTQELTPLPISIEDGQSDDEDQTVFEIQRQNIRIL